MRAQIKKHSRESISGDTIVEVLIAIAIAALAIGVSYATAERSLQQAITAKEHSEALNILENQLTDLQLRYQKTDNATFVSTFAATGQHYCLVDSAVAANDPNWGRQANTNISDTSPLDTPPYNASCKKAATGQGAVYWTDIATMTSTAPTSQNGTLYHVTVRWDRIGGGPTNQAGIYYKLNGS